MIFFQNRLKTRQTMASFFNLLPCRYIFFRAIEFFRTAIYGTQTMRTLYRHFIPWFFIPVLIGCGTPSKNFLTSPPLFIWPVKTRGKKVTQKFKVIRKHEGIDISGSKNTPVYAAANGRVIYTGQRFSGYGKLIIIEHQGDKWASFYAHLNKFKVREGQKVKAGQLIGLMGNTGRSSGIHLHFEIRHNLKPVNPLPLLNH